MKGRSSILLLIFAVAVITSVSSCTRTYICHCNLNYSGAPGLPTNTFKEFDITDTKSNAQSKCKAESGNYVNNYITTVDSCYLY